MNSDIENKINELNLNFKEICGHSFTHFFCPILFRDEDVSLCKAHIINKSFPNSSRKWTIQRKDVDNFFGSNFESEFTKLKYKDNITLGDTVTNLKLSKAFRPKILVDNEPVEIFNIKGKVPQVFSKIEFVNEGIVKKIGIKMSPKEVLAKENCKWDLEASVDIRVPAVVALLKSAHLTLFDMFGYNYALSLGGQYIGNYILGNFYLQNYNKQRNEVLNNATIYFKKFANLVRPIISNDNFYKGTIDDGFCLVCMDNEDLPWGLLVIVKVDKLLNSVVVPMINSVKPNTLFLKLLNNELDVIDAYISKFDGMNWKIDNNCRKIQWPNNDY